MKYQINVSGMSLSEVLISLAVIAILLAPLMIVQGNVLVLVNRSSQKLSQIVHAQTILYQCGAFTDFTPKEFTKKEIYGVPPVQYTYSRTAVSDKSSLKIIPGLFFESVTIDVPGKKVRKKDKDTLVSFIFKPEQKKHEQIRGNAR